MKRFLLIVLSLFLLLFSGCGEIKRENSLEINVLNIGKADCIVIQIQDKCILIDTGEEENVPEILAFLQQRNVKKIHTLIFSHFDKDHVGGAAEILKSLSVERVLQSSFSSDRKEYENYIEQCKRKNIKPNVLTEPLQFTVADCTFTVLPPQKEQYERKQDNNSSLIVTLRHGEHHLGFFGDAMEERLDEYLSDANEGFDFIKIPYHGNYLKNLPELIEQTGPSYAAVTCSNKNPADEKTLTLLAENNVRYYLTQNGTVQLLSDGKKLIVIQ